MEEEQYGRTKNTPSPPDGITFQLQLHRGFRMGRTCAPPGYINLGKATSSCARMRDPRGASGYLESPIVTVYFTADVEAHFFVFFLLFLHSLSFSLSLFSVTHGDANMDDISRRRTTTTTTTMTMTTTTTALSRFPWRVRLPHAAAGL